MFIFLFVLRKIKKDQVNKKELQQEIEANMFAMELLMPKNLFLSEASKIQKKINSSWQKNYLIKDRVLDSRDLLTYRLAKKFAVSEYVIKVRMINLGILTTI